jgi:hypothetical protein
MFITARDSASIMSLLQKLRFQFNLHLGNRKVGWVWDDSHVVFGEKIPW